MTAAELAEWEKVRRSQAGLNTYSGDPNQYGDRGYEGSDVPESNGGSSAFGPVSPNGGTAVGPAIPPGGAQPPATAPDQPKPKAPERKPWTYQGTGYQAPTVGAAGTFQSTMPGFTPQAGGVQAQSISDPQAFQRAAFTVPPPPKPLAPPPPAFDFMSIARGIPQLSGLPTMDAAMSPEYRASLEKFAMDGMANPNRFTSPWLTSARSVIENDAKQTREAGRLSIAELMQSRGLIGSSYEGEAALGLEDQIRADEMERQMELLSMMASVEAEDRTAAGSLGTQVGRLGLDTASAKFDSEFRVADLKQRDSIQRAEVSLRAAMAGDDAAMRRVEHELQTMRAMDEATMSRADLQLQSQEIDLRAHQIQQEAIQRGEGMRLEQARSIAELQVRKDEIAQRESSQSRDRELSAWEIQQRDARAAQELQAQIERDRAGNEFDRNSLAQREMSEQERLEFERWAEENRILMGLL